MTKGLTAVLIAGFFSMLTAYAIRFSYGVLLPEILPALAISKAEAGVIYASYFMAYLICSPAMGFLVDRYDLRIILTMSMGIFLTLYRLSDLTLFTRPSEEASRSNSTGNFVNSSRGVFPPDSRGEIS